MEENKELSKHELKELRKKEKEEQNTVEEEKKDAQKFKKNIIKYSIIGIILIVVVYFAFKMFSGPKVESYTKGPVHWHAELNVYICGKKVGVPEELPQGQHHLGLPLLHTHADGLIHIEGQIWKKEDITLGAYMDAINVPFANNTIIDYKNDGMCNDGKSNKIKMLVNGEESSEFRNYVVNDKDKIEIRYE
ncbi:MAG: hypothetical protein AABY07_08610 [Nanoarchaeota archaeon]